MNVTVQAELDLVRAMSLMILFHDDLTTLDVETLLIEEGLDIHISDRAKELVALACSFFNDKSKAAELL